MNRAGSLCRDPRTLVKRNKNQLCIYMTTEPASLFCWDPSIVKLGSRVEIHTVCCGDDYFPKENFKLFDSLFHLDYLVFPKSLFSIADLFAVRYLWDVWNENKCCVVTQRAKDIRVVWLDTFARIVCLLQLWIKTSELNYSIWATPK